MRSRSMMQPTAQWALCIALSTLVLNAWSLENGLGRTPPLGFNTWNYFGCDINETVIRTAAEKLISVGLARAGYTYINIDDCWHTRVRDDSGQLQADPDKFPSGMAALGKWIHSKGLKFGIYSDAGLFTCQGYPGSRYHEIDDAALFASWGVDYLKYDNCFSVPYDVKERYTAMRDALNATGRQIYFSMCDWGVGEPWLWGDAVGNSWRTDADISTSWDSILRSLDNGAAGLAKYAGPGGWNDPDMLEVGNGDLSTAQQRSHFALWALVKAPLLIGANLDQLHQVSLTILKAKEVIAINQDALGVAGDIIWKEGPGEIWAGPVLGDARAVVLFNRHHDGDPTTLKVTWEQLGYDTTQPGFKAVVRDLYAEQDLGQFEKGYEAKVGCHNVAVLKITPVVQPSVDPQGGMKANRATGQLAGTSAAIPVREGFPSQLLSLFDSTRQGIWQTAAGWGCALWCVATGSSSSACSTYIEGKHPCKLEHHCSNMQPEAVQVSLGVMDSKQEAHHQQVTGDITITAWRPWHGKTASKLQSQLRVAAAAARKARAQQFVRRKDIPPWKHTLAME